MSKIAYAEAEFAAQIDFRAQNERGVVALYNKIIIGNRLEFPVLLFNAIHYGQRFVAMFKFNTT